MMFSQGSARIGPARSPQGSVLGPQAAVLSVRPLTLAFNPYAAKCGQRADLRSTCHPLRHACHPLRPFHALICGFCAALPRDMSVGRGDMSATQACLRSRTHLRQSGYDWSVGRWDGGQQDRWPILPRSPVKLPALVGWAACRPGEGIGGDMSGTPTWIARPVA